MHCGLPGIPEFFSTMCCISKVRGSYRVLRKGNWHVEVVRQKPRGTTYSLFPLARGDSGVARCHGLLCPIAARTDHYCTAASAAGDRHLQASSCTAVIGE